MSREERRVVILGATGSIGTQTLDVIERLNEKGYPFSVIALSAGKNIPLLAEQIERFGPHSVCVGDEEGAKGLRGRFPSLDILTGEGGLCELAQIEGADLVVNALVGAVGLAPTLAALSLGRTVALANKESLVIGGGLVTACLEEHGGAILPIDSEHNALFQCLRGGRTCEVKRIIITASGGPFLRTPLPKLPYVRVEEALSHPNWAMGSRITIDSATMVNKGFEVIEAHHLFALPYERIERSSTRNRSSTRWSSTRMGRSSPSLPPRTCASRSNTPSPTPNGPRRNSHVSTSVRSQQCGSSRSIMTASPPLLRSFPQRKREERPQR